MYNLTLTEDERAAFDFVGDRYQTGYKIRRILEQCLPEDKCWDDKGEIEFKVPEHLAWEINELAEDEAHLWPLFGNDLVEKMVEFTCKIV